jgi:hypothetical protein
MLRLKLILLFRSVPNDDIKLRELLERFSLIERITRYVSGGLGVHQRRRSKGVADGSTKRGHWRSRPSPCLRRLLPQCAARTGVSAMTQSGAVRKS